MATTIQVENSTKQKLLKLKLELSLQGGNVYTYDKTIQYLLSTLDQENSTGKKTYNRQDFQQYKKSLENGASEVFQQERMRDLKEEEKYLKPKA